jgi:hypothetical protein
MPQQDRIGDEVPARHDLLGRKAELAAGSDFGAQQVASGDMRHLQVFLRAVRLRALAGTRRAQQNQSHR